MEINKELTVNDLSAKFKSKKELYNMFTGEGNIYLYPKQDSTQQFLWSMMFGVKQLVKWEDANVIKVPQYKGLHVKDLLRFATTNINIKRYLSDYEYSKDPNIE